MPFDQKKINGPDNSFSYKQYIESNKEENQDFELKKGRKDGREPNESRKIAVQMNAISKAKGSCYIENGNTKLICGVFELREISRSTRYNDKGQLYCDFKYAPFSRDNRKSLNENDEKLISNSIKTALESVVCLHEFPNYQIDIFIMVLEDDGSILSTAIMAAGVAFIDACIPCFDIPASSTIAFYDGKALVDPTAEEEEIVNTSNPQNNHGTITLTSLNSIDQVAQILFTGYIEPSILKEAKRQLLENNKIHEKYLKKVISMKIVKENRES
ncbi:hypothetical protein PVAND_010111 [Polypedilum vanderplanki]|uniref:Uncharacterized protein n=1 Tax=Polypedilum vanderplanki TaxID=319348 RepID=A0A9J6CEK8_POLVA|nr:hypothetical protein PVAND_010111 [Polypedilum vanderplanki]